MQPLISGYLERINTRYQTGISRENAYRGDLQYLLELKIMIGFYRKR